MKLSTFAFMLLLFFTLSGFSADSARDTEKKENLGYALGVDLGKTFRERRIDFDFDAFMRGFIDGLEGNRTVLNPKELEAIKKEFDEELAERRKRHREARMQAQSKKNTEEGREFLAANRKKESVTELESGLQYISLKEGTGPKPAPGKKLTLHYRGSFLDGQEFESTYTDNRPIETELGKVMKGWAEALQLMNEGAKWRLFVPAALGHGERGNGPIGPSAVLIFEVELMSVER